MFRSRSWKPAFIQSVLVATWLPGICLAQNGAQIVTASTPSIQPSSTTSAPAQTHTIQVGLADHKFKPETTEANIGDTVEFAFYPRNHSVVRAEYGFPCIPYEMTGPSKTGFFSGFQPVDTVLSSPPTYRILINDTNPIFFYCSAPGSCITYGMVGAINSNAFTSIQQQQKLALNSTYMLNPGEPFPAETPSPSNAPSNTSTSRPGPGTANDNKSGLSKRAIIAMVVTSTCITILAALLFFFWGRTKGLKDELKRKATTMWRPDAYPTGHMRDMSTVVPRAELRATESDNGMHHQPYYYQYPQQPPDDGTAYQHQHQPYPSHLSFSPAQTMSLYYPPPPPSSPSPLHSHLVKTSITSPLDPHPAYNSLSQNLHQNLHQNQFHHNRTALQSPIRHELDSQEQMPDSGNPESITTAAAVAVAATNTAHDEQDSKVAAHQVREVEVSTPTIPTPVSTGECRNVVVDADVDEIEPVPSYFDAVYASSRTASGAGQRRNEIDGGGKGEKAEVGNGKSEGEGK
ncbi:uncharacterized protein yc1106_00768 [Curvularia clavata]|uniref:Extracellular serine-rich protein n=1 Tax=Curvularia clavata TaxID=95742 RepID=A0A9Q9DPC1_CURCL|nr:uncharacterized protein yc1106_00768 [Curvularia clavata]